jgi:hypothetical protein
MEREIERRLVGCETQILQYLPVFARQCNIMGHCPAAGDQCVEASHHYTREQL